MRKTCLTLREERNLSLACMMYPDLNPVKHKIRNMLLEYQNKDIIKAEKVGVLLVKKEDND